jgi:prolyl oligopeptidase PreP (S9A serine peptidase family)
MWLFSKYTLVILIFFGFVLTQGFFAQGANFNNYINDATDGSSLEEAIVLDNICDYKQCHSKKCILDVFEYTVLEQEFDYVASKFGIRGRDWEVVGETDIETHTLVKDKYYDDLGINVFATGENKVLHFDITSPVKALLEESYQRKG